MYVTPGNINDVDPYIERLDVQIKKFNFDTKYVGADAGYLTNNICKKIFERELKAVMGYRRGPHVKGKFSKLRFQYVKELRRASKRLFCDINKPPQPPDCSESQGSARSWCNN